MRCVILTVLLGVCLLVAGCSGGDGSSAPVASAPAPSGMPGDAGDGGMPGGDGGTPAGGDGYTPPSPDGGGGAPPGDASGGNPMDEGYSPPPDGGLSGGYDGGAGPPGYGPDGMTPEGMPLRPRIKPIREQAIDALRRNNDAEGFRLLATFLAASPGGQTVVAERVAWVPALRRPAIGPRIGIAAHYVKPVGDFAESPQPIGSPELRQALAALAQNSKGSGQRGESSGGAGGISGDLGGGGDGSQSAEKQLEFYTGDLGTRFLSALKAKIDGGAYGLLFKELAEEIARPAPTIDPNSPGNPGDPNFAGGGLPGGEFPGDGALDSGLPGIAPGEGQAGAGPARLAMGVTWLGKFDKDQKDDLAKLAQESGLDLLVTYEISLTATKVGNLIQNQTRFKITDVKKNETPLFTSPVFDNRTVMQAREKGLSEEDPVEKQVTRAIEALDRVCQPSALPPTVTAERAKTRIAGLIAEKPADPLPVLIEARFYAAKGLLTDAEEHAAAVALVGEAEYAQLVASAGGGDMNDYLGTAISLPGLIELLHGVNNATGVTAREKAKKAREEANPTQPRRGWGGLLPLGGTGR